jgi:hypothetical protein
MAGALLALAQLYVQGTPLCGAGRADDFAAALLAMAQLAV